MPRRSKENQQFSRGSKNGERSDSGSASSDHMLLSQAFWATVNRDAGDLLDDELEGVVEDDDADDDDFGEDFPEGKEIKEEDLISDAELQALDYLMKEDDPVGVYFRQMSQYPLLTADEEVSLGKRVELGKYAAEELRREQEPPLSEDDIAQLREILQNAQDAREHLARSNTRLVISIAKRYMGQGLHFLDIIQEGNVGLMRAVDKYEHQRGNKFSTYATWWIRQAITRALSQKVRTIRIPLYRVEKSRLIAKFFRQFYQDNGREPTIDEVSEAMGLEKDYILDLFRTSQNIASLDEVRQVSDENGLATLMEIIEDDVIPRPEASANDALRKERIKEILSFLPPRKQLILKMRYGIGGDEDGNAYGTEEHTLDQIGQVLGITRERVRQLEKEALNFLRSPRLRGSLVDLED